MVWSWLVMMAEEAVNVAVEDYGNAA